MARFVVQMSFSYVAVKKVRPAHGEHTGRCRTGTGARKGLFGTVKRKRPTVIVRPAAGNCPGEAPEQSRIRAHRREGGADRKISVVGVVLEHVVDPGQEFRVVGKHGPLTVDRCRLRPIGLDDAVDLAPQKQAGKRQADVVGDGDFQVGVPRKPQIRDLGFAHDSIGEGTDFDFWRKILGHALFQGHGPKTENPAACLQRGFPCR